MEASHEESRKRFEEKQQQNRKIHSVEELNRLKSENQKKREQDGNPEESMDLFDRTFQEKTRALKSEISLLSSEDIESKCESLRKKVSLISDYLNQSIHFINSYTILQSQQKLNALIEEINQAQTSLAPRKKFAFSRRTAAKQQEKSEIVQSKEISLVLEGIQDQENQEFRKFDEELFQYNCYQLKNLRNCSVLLLGRLKAVHILALDNCQVFIGAVAGAAHITDCKNCQIYVASHQIRIHQSIDTDFYIFAATNPIVESVSRVRFAPFLLKYAGNEQHLEHCGLNSRNLWDQVQDFKWLKQEKSPNWEVIEEGQRVIREF
jgi:hypothetical protein